MEPVMSTEIGKTIAGIIAKPEHPESSLLATCSRRTNGCGLLKALKILKTVPNTMMPFFDAPEVAVCVETAVSVEVAVCEEVASAMTAVVQGLTMSCIAP
jgi:hypothetical protein